MKNEKVLKVWLYGVMLFLVFVSYSLYLIVNKEDMNFYKHILNITSIILILLPVVFEWLFKLKFSLTAIILYWVFIIISQVMGTVWKLYVSISWLDNLAHCYSGFLICILSYSILFGIQKTPSLWTTILFGIGFVLIVGVVWEIAEFFGDKWFGMNNQCIRKDDVALVGQAAVVDTMVDLMMNLLGAVISNIVYIVLYLKGKTLSERLLIKRQKM